MAQIENTMKHSGPLQIGASGSATLTVEDTHTAAHVGSGCEAVLATPVMIALMEAAAVDATEHLLEPGHTSLGIRIAVDHTAPTPIGGAVTATAELIEIKGRRLFFRVTAHDGTRQVGSGEHTRAIVSIDEFRQRLNQPTQ